MNDSDELNTVEEARCVGAEYAARHNVNEAQAKEFAARWFKTGEGFPERKAMALESLLKKKFGLLY